MIAAGMNGQLGEHSLAELISEISAKGLSGALRVVRERVKAAIYFESGAPVYATSNLRLHRLTEYLRKSGVVRERITGIKATDSDLAIAAALVSQRAITDEALNLIFAEQVSDVVRMLLLWTNGEWTFDSRARLSAPVRANIPMRQLIIEAARRLDLDAAVAKFRNGRELISGNQNSIDGLTLSPSEGFLLSRVEGSIELNDLLALSGLPESEAHRAIYSLVLAGLLKREFQPQAFRSSEGTKPGVERRPASIAKRHVPEAVAPVVTPAQEAEDFLERLAHTTNYYEVLNVAIRAEAAEIKRAYHGLARRFHPDRFHEQAHTQLHKRLESAFARITQAQETLLDSDLRAAYDVKIQALKQISDSRPKHSAKPSEAEPIVGAKIAAPTLTNDLEVAEKSFQEGVAALQLGQTNAAISSLTSAARLRPDQPAYRACLGRALAGNERTRRLAEVELLAAIKLDPANASYRVMLAKLYRDLGFSRRAVAELGRALAIDSQNTEAREMMRALKSGK
jgi:tetratricopeptide (TPR) repeat protein